jgi:hypothetical protein
MKEILPLLAIYIFEVIVGFHGEEEKRPGLPSFRARLKRE